ncbi:hypothetical protein E2493_02950 [Sphingomonas parva]|uniref:Uncharacterized protein n=1 Tax=Sphingomonas parva TaxID=2555898 RepID=A0A4Y8ZUW9_9SPHN|nr:protease inhibitor I42 family protein [Sphingomonas parva]TFI59808.1 hypothetical protein E2493_02950 [Sphingomonas parva]
MKTTTPDGALEVTVGEVFGVTRPGRETSGFAVSIEVPAGVRRIGVMRDPSTNFGGAPQVTEQFRCECPGTYQIIFEEGRRWEPRKARSATVIRCMDR